MSDGVMAEPQAAITNALSRFETLVLSQPPAETAWQPVTDYSFEARRTIEGEHPQRIKDVFAPTVVVDAGCGEQGILVRLMREVGIQAIGFDPSVTANPFARYLMRGSLLEPCDGPPFADLVICREVLEHLTVLQLRRAVTHLCGYASKFVYVTTRFAKDPQSLLDVDTSDDLDPTHITMLNQDFLRVLFVLEGFKRRADLETQMDWMKKGRVLVYERAA